MGQNLILNMDSHGFVVCAFNRTVDKVSGHYADFAFYYKNQNKLRNFYIYI